jgi:hypothetical protein
VRFVVPPEIFNRVPIPQGTIVVSYVVGTDGIPKEITLVSGLDSELDELARKAVSDLRYHPATYRGQAVEIVLEQRFEVIPPVVETEPPEPLPTEVERPKEVEEPATGPVRVQGRIRESGLRTGIPSAVVLVVPAGTLPLGRVKRKNYGGHSWYDRVGLP